MAYLEPVNSHHQQQSHITQRKLSSNQTYPSAIIPYAYKIKASKTDQRGHGQTILLGCTNSSTCPISLLEQYLEASHHLSPHLPLFHFADGKLLTRYSLATSLKECIIAVGESPKHFSTHSLRIGGAMAAAAAGITPSIIQELRRTVAE